MLVMQYIRKKKQDYLTTIFNELALRDSERIKLL